MAPKEGFIPNAALEGQDSPLHSLLLARNGIVEKNTGLRLKAPVRKIVEQNLPFGSKELDPEGKFEALGTIDYPSRTVLVDPQRIAQSNCNLPK